MYSYTIRNIFRSFLFVWMIGFFVLPAAAETQHFQFIENTGNNATVFVPVDANPIVNGELLQPGDEIGVFTADGMCVGAAVWDGTNIAITVWGNNDQTAEKDGMNTGDSLFYRVWQESTDTEFPNIQVEYNTDSPFANTTGRYSIDAFYILESLSTFPQPAAPALISPPDEATDQPLELIFEWEETEMTDSYHLQVATDTDFTDVTIDEEEITSHQFEASGFDYGMNYYWRVSGTNLAGTGDWSEVWNFSVIDKMIEIQQPGHNTVWKVNTSKTIEWTSIGVETLRLEYTPNDGSDWETIETSIDASDENFEWIVPSTPSTRARIRLTDTSNDNTTAMSPVFSIYPVQLSLSRSISFGNPSQTTSYRMIGIPGNNTFQLSSVMTGTAGTDWTAFHDDGSDEDYLIEYDGSSTFNFLPGRGFWILSRNAINYTDEQNAVELLEDGTYEIPLHDGWNIISNPFDEAVDWETVQSFNEITQPIWDFSGSFNQTNSMQPFDGYYFYNNENLSSLAIPYPNAVSIENALPSILEQAYRLKLSIEKNGAVQSDIAIGVLHENIEHIDRLTVYAPPSDFEDSSIRLHDGRVHTSYVNSSDDGYTFDVRITLPKNKTYTVQLNGDAYLTDQTVILIDKESGKIHRFDNAHTITISSSTGVEEYKLVIGNADYIENVNVSTLPDEVTLSQNYPNPFNPETTIEYSIPQDKNNTRVTLEIYNTLGQRVRTLVDDHRTSGFHIVSWDGRNDTGQVVTSGFYIYRLRVGSTVLHNQMIFLK